MNKRAHIHYTGGVQGVGFRYTARSLAQGLGIKGWVRNSMDGGVELVVEGEESTLKDLLRKIKEEMNYTSFTENISWQGATGEFTGFEIRF